MWNFVEINSCISSWGVIYFFHKSSKEHSLMNQFAAQFFYGYYYFFTQKR